MVNTLVSGLIGVERFPYEFGLAGFIGLVL